MQHCATLWRREGLIVCLSAAQVAAGLGAKPPTSTGELTPDEEALIATDLVQEEQYDGAAYLEQQPLRLNGPSHDSQLPPTASSQAESSFGSQSKGDTVHAQHPSSSSGAAPHLVPTHSYRHGRLQHDSMVDKIDSSDTAAELQPA